MIKTIAIIVVMLAANIMMVISIRKAAVRVDYSLQRYFLQKIGTQFNTKTVRSDINNPEDVSDFVSDRTESDAGPKQMLSVSDHVNRASYKSSTLLHDYKTIKVIGDYTPDVALECVKKSLQKTSVSDGRDYSGILKNLNFETVYSLNTLSSEDQKKLLTESFNDSQLLVLKDYLQENSKEFDCINFYSYVKQMAQLYDSGFVVRTGNIQDKGKVLPDGTPLSYDDNICEGSQVVYGDRLYDFSL